MEHRTTILVIVLILSAIGGVHGQVVSRETGAQADVAVKGSAREAVLTGRVTKAPSSPVGRVGVQASSEPAPNIRLVIMNSQGQEVGSVVTNEEGVFTVSLPPGTYHVETTSLTGTQFTKDLPAAVVVTEGRETRLDINIDSGIR